MSNNTEIVVYATYRDILLAPEERLEHLKNKIGQFDPVEQIAYCSFWNMICQTRDIDELRKMQYIEFRGLPNINEIIQRRELIFGRETLLYYISQVIKNNINGKSKITGQSDLFNPQYIDFGRCLLLSNSVINELKQGFYEREFIKNFPYDSPKTIYWHYYHRIIRYSFIYSELIPQLVETKRRALEAGIEAIKETHKITISNIFSAVKSLFVWFIGLKEGLLMRNEIPEDRSIMFNFENPLSFYIQRSNYKNFDTMIKVLDLFSMDYKGYQDEFAGASCFKDVIDNNVFKYIQCFYDNPVFKCSDDVYCILDLKFFLEKACKGIIWMMKGALKKESNINNSLGNNIFSENGYLIEAYFDKLMKQIFNEDVEITSNTNNSPDAIIGITHKEVKTFVVIEFTTKQNRIASLYNEDAKCFFEDVDRMLFKGDRSDKGKFINLNKYVTNIELNNKDEKINIIPILITESPIGDYDLLNRNQGYLDKKLNEKSLTSLQRWNPIILNLDDIEIFWGAHAQATITQDFVEKLIQWRTFKVKGEYWYSFSNYSTEGCRIVNEDYLKIFNHANLTNELS